MNLALHLSRMPLPCLRRVSANIVGVFSLLLLSSVAPQAASADLISFNISGGSGNFDPFGADPNRNILVSGAHGVFTIDTATNTFDMHLNFADGDIHALNNGIIDVITAGFLASGGPTTRPGHEVLHVANEANNLVLRGFADGRPRATGNEGDAFINDAIGRNIHLGVNDMFFAANPDERILYIALGNVFAHGHVPGSGFLTLNFDPIAVNPPSPPQGPDLPPTEIPEPASLALLATGLLGSAARRRKRA